MTEEKQKLPRSAKVLTAVCGCLAAVGIITTVCIFVFQKINQEKVCIYQDGKAVDKLDVTVNVIPGTTQSYDVFLRAKMGGPYNVSVNFEGTPNSLSNLVNCSITPSETTWSHSLTDLFAAKSTFVVFTNLSTDQDTKFTVSYTFDQSIVESSIEPIDFSLSFSIKR